MKKLNYQVYEGNPPEDQLDSNNLYIEGDIENGVIKSIKSIKMSKGSEVIDFPVQQQADWKQDDNTKPDYIKNKPTPLVYDGWFSIGDHIFSTDTEESAEEEIVAAVKAGRTVIIKDNNGAEIRLGVVTCLDAYNQPIMVVGDDNGDAHALHYTWSV